ncbi:MAG: TA system VapC family ribonuclease toxin [Acidimicrobiales bacterium]
MTTTFLADGTVLVALTVVDHVHHDLAVGWFEQTEPDLATCPITEGTLLRFLLREGVAAVDAVAVLDTIRSQDWHVFWPAAIPYQAAHLEGVIGHRQVTDAYLVALARHEGARVVTFDRGLAALHGDAVHLLGAAAGD